MDNWQDELELPDDLKTNPTVAKYKSPVEAIKGLVEAQGRLGRSVTHPSEDAGEDTWNEYVEKVQRTSNGKLILHPEHGDGDHAKEFWKMVGVPEDPKDYAPPEELQGMSNEQVDEVRRLAAESGWTKKQFKTTMALLDQQALTQQQQLDELKANNQAIIDRKLGMAKDQKIAGIMALAPEFADPDNPPAWIENPDMLTAGDILWLNNIVTAFEGKGPQAHAQPADHSMPTPEEIREQQNDLRDRLLKEAHTMDRGEYKRLLTKLERLGKMAAGEIA